MLIVIFGSGHLEQTDMAAALIRVCPSRVRHFSLAGQACVEARMRLLQMDTVTRAGYGMTTVITGVDSSRELSHLRRIGAHVCHLYGPLSSPYRLVRILDTDLWVTPQVSRMVPEHVLGPAELLSECEHRRRHRLTAPVAEVLA